jgi:ABC-type nitrate/sulfonate/bicarbonate transport system permease component
MKRFPSWLRSLLFPLGLIIGYECVVRALTVLGWNSAKFIVLPPPSQIITQLFNLLLDTTILSAILYTAVTTILGFSLGLLGAIIVGTIIGFSRGMEIYFAPTLLFLRSLPIILYVPLAIVLLGSDISLPIALAAFITTLYGMLPVSKAVREYDEEKLIFLRSRGLASPNIILQFILPEIITALATTISITITLALAVTIASEMLLEGLQGLGSLLNRARENSQYSSLWAYTCLLGAMGFSLHYLVWKTLYFAAPWVKSSLKEVESHRNEWH